MHMVQLQAVPPVVPHPRAARGEAFTAAEQDMSDVLLLEYCWRGSLHKALCKVYKQRVDNDEDLSFPDRALWHIFHCRKSMRSTTRLLLD